MELFGADRPIRDKVLLHRVSSAAFRHTRRDLTAAEFEAAVAEIRAITTRADLLAELAGLALGAANTLRADHFLAAPSRRTAKLLRAAGAENAGNAQWEASLARWEAEGRQRILRSSRPSGRPPDELR